MSQATPDILTGANFPGGTGIQAIEDALKANGSTHSGATAPSYRVLGTPWYDTVNEKYKIWDGIGWVAVGGLPDYKTLAVNDTTPSVLNGTSFKTANTAATTISTFDDGAAGQIITIRVEDINTTLGSGLTATGMVIPLLVGDVIQLQCNGAASWKQIAGSVGMGRYVPLSPANQIEDWPAITQGVSFVDVNLSDDGVRKGAVAVAGRIFFDDVLTEFRVHGRKKGDVTAINRGNAIGVVLINIQRRVLPFILPVNDDAYIQIAHTQSGVSAEDYLGYVDGYWI